MNEWADNVVERFEDNPVYRQSVINQRHAQHAEERRAAILRLAQTNYGGSVVISEEAKALAKLKEEYAAFVKTLEKAREPARDYLTTLSELNRFLKGGAIDAAEFNKQLNILNDNTIFQDRLSLADRGSLNFRQRVEGGRDNDLLSGPDDLQSLRDRTKAGLDGDRDRDGRVASIQRQARQLQNLIGLDREEQRVLNEKFVIQERLRQLRSDGYDETQVLQIKTVLEETNRLNRVNEENLRYAEELKSAWDEAFGSFIDNLLQGKLEFSNFIDHLGSELLRLQLQKNLVEPLSNAFQNFGASIFGGGGGEGTPSYSYQHFTPNPHTRALGGPVARGNPYLVGERGPELFVPGANGRIIPNGKMGGNQVNVTVNNTVSDQVSANVYQESQGQVILEIVRDDAQGGKFGRQINGVTGTARQGV